MKGWYVGDGHKQYRENKSMLGERYFKYFPFSIYGCGPTDERCQVVLKCQSNHPWFYQLICKKILVTE